MTEKAKVTIIVTDENGNHYDPSQAETVLIHMHGQVLPAGMVGSLLRALADEVDPQPKKYWNTGTISYQLPGGTLGNTNE